MSVQSPVIGIEIHVQLNTQTKLFCGCKIAFGDDENKHTCPTCLGLPGSLPTINQSVIEKAIMVGKALNCKISNKSIFERKNYSYPDLPKGYQISQFKEPICKSGYVKFYSNNELKKINITRVHIEEDAGKLVHIKDYSLLDYNRAGTALLEIVSEPEIDSSNLAADYSRAIKGLVVYLGVSDGNLEEGSIRCDCNISIRNKDKSLGVKVELKNLNSFRFIEKALEHEIERQSGILNRGGSIVQETRQYDSTLNKTKSMRTKEDSQDYRYFPDPDLITLVLSDKDLNINMPEPQINQIEKLLYYVTIEEAIELAKSSQLANASLEIFENYKNINWAVDHLCMISDLPNMLEKIESLKKIIQAVGKKEISIRTAKHIFEKCVLNKGNLEELIEKYKQVSDRDQVLEILECLIEENNKQWDNYLRGEDKIRDYFVGKVMSKTKGKANPNIVISIINQLRSK